MAMPVWPSSGIRQCFEPCSDTRVIIFPIRIGKLPVIILGLAACHRLSTDNQSHSISVLLQRAAGAREQVSAHVKIDREASGRELKQLQLFYNRTKYVVLSK